MLFRRARRASLHVFSLDHGLDLSRQRVPQQQCELFVPSPQGATWQLDGNDMCRWMLLFGYAWEEVDPSPIHPLG